MLSALFNSPKWEQARCLEEPDLNFFFPDSQLELEKRWPRIWELCGTCIHQIECLQYALDNHIFDGIWAATTGDQRKDLVKQKEESRSHRFREITHLLSTGLSKNEVAAKLGIKVASLERTLDRAKRKGLQ